jgi:hypothetical protein
MRNRLWDVATKLENGWQAASALNYCFVQILNDKDNDPSETIVAGMQHLGYLVTDDLLNIRDTIGVAVKDLDAIAKGGER